MRLNPPPDPVSWAAITDPDERLERALEGLYGYYRRNEQMMENLHRDEDTGRSSSSCSEVRADRARPWLADNIPGAQAELRERDGHLTVAAQRIGEVHEWLAQYL
jgi:hypothetical protein